MNTAPTKGNGLDGNGPILVELGDAMAPLPVPASKIFARLPPSLNPATSSGTERASSTKRSLR